MSLVHLEFGRVVGFTRTTEQRLLSLIDEVFITALFLAVSPVYGLLGNVPHVCLHLLHRVGVGDVAHSATNGLIVGLITLALCPVCGAEHVGHGIDPRVVDLVIVGVSSRLDGLGL